MLLLIDSEEDFVAEGDALSVAVRLMEDDGDPEAERVCVVDCDADTLGDIEADEDGVVD